MYKMIYLGETSWFNTFEEVKGYFNLEDRTDINDLPSLEDTLKEQYQGMAYPTIVEMDF